jgi:hypothetical protein
MMIFHRTEKAKASISSKEKTGFISGAAFIELRILNFQVTTQNRKVFKE